MKQQYELTLRLSEDLLRRLLYVCETENRTPSAEVALLLRNSFSYSERAKGKMDPSKLAAYDLSAYRVEAERRESSESV